MAVYLVIQATVCRSQAVKIIFTSPNYGTPLLQASCEVSEVTKPPDLDSRRAGAAHLPVVRATKVHNITKSGPTLVAFQPSGKT